MTVTNVSPVLEGCDICHISKNANITKVGRLYIVCTVLIFGLFVRTRSVVAALLAIVLFLKVHKIEIFLASILKFVIFLC